MSGFWFLGSLGLGILVGGFLVDLVRGRTYQAELAAIRERHTRELESYYDRGSNEVASWFIAADLSVEAARR